MTAEERALLALNMAHDLREHSLTPDSLSCDEIAEIMLAALERTHVAVAREPSGDVVWRVATALFDKEWSEHAGSFGMNNDADYWRASARAAIAALTEGEQ